MEIYQTQLVSGRYRAVITSDKPIFVTFQDLVGLSGNIGFEMDPNDIMECLEAEDCPTPVNHDEGHIGQIDEGIWVFERLFAFFREVMDKKLGVA